MPEKIQIMRGHRLASGTIAYRGAILVIGEDLSLAEAQRKISRGDARPLGSAEDEAPASVTVAEAGASSAGEIEIADPAPESRDPKPTRRRKRKKPAEKKTGGTGGKSRSRRK